MQKANRSLSRNQRKAGLLPLMNRVAAVLTRLILRANPANWIVEFTTVFYLSGLLIFFAKTWFAVPASDYRQSAEVRDLVNRAWQLGYWVEKIDAPLWADVYYIWSKSVSALLFIALLAFRPDLKQLSFIVLFTIINVIWQILVAIMGNSIDRYLLVDILFVLCLLTATALTLLNRNGK